MKPIDIEPVLVEDVSEPRPPTLVNTLGLDVTRPRQQWFEGPIVHFNGHHYNPQGEAAFRALVPERYKRG
jgi:hypothetical protein